MAIILRINTNDLNNHFWENLQTNMAKNTEIEIHIPSKSIENELFTDTDFWNIINHLDWSHTDSSAILTPSVTYLATQPIAHIYLFEDKLAEKLQQLDTPQHAQTYLAHEEDDYLSVDDFLYQRCAVVAEGQSFFERVKNNPSEFPQQLSFEPLLNLASKAYYQKTNRTFHYHAAISYKTYGNKNAWNNATQ